MKTLIQNYANMRDEELVQEYRNLVGGDEIIDYLDGEFTMIQLLYKLLYNAPEHGEEIEPTDGYDSLYAKFSEVIPPHIQNKIFLQEIGREKLIQRLDVNNRGI
jgi:hypothetical protein